MVLRYGGETVETEMGKCEWREEFSFGVQGEETEMEVSVVERGGIFRADSEVAEGSINLLETNVVKCILGNRERKVAILYFKLSLV